MKTTTIICDHCGAELSKAVLALTPACVLNVGPYERHFCTIDCLKPFVDGLHARLQSEKNAPKK